MNKLIYIPDIFNYVTQFVSNTDKYHMIHMNKYTMSNYIESYTHNRYIFVSKYNELRDKYANELYQKSSRFAKFYVNDIKEVEICENATHIIFLNGFNQPIDKVIWPNSLTHVIFGVTFNQPIDKVIWPNSLTHMVFGCDFNQPLDKVVWPPLLTYISFGTIFNRQIGKGVLLDLLTHVSGYLNRSIDKVIWPSSLTHIVFGWPFNQPIDNVKWPSSLTHITLSTHYSLSTSELNMSQITIIK